MVPSSEYRSEMCLSFEAFPMLNHRALNVPFFDRAKPTFVHSVGDLRFRAPVPNDPYYGEVNATAYGNLCYPYVFPATLPNYTTPDQRTYFTGQFELPITPTYDEDCKWSEALVRS